jgi:hypothetical protein
MHKFRSSLVSRIFLFSILVVLAVATPSSADLITWNLNASLDDGGSVEGSFVYDTSSGAVTTWSIDAEFAPATATTASYLTNPYHFTPADSSAVIYGDNSRFRLEAQYELSSGIRVYILGIEVPFASDFAGAAPILVGGGLYQSYREDITQLPYPFDLVKAYIEDGAGTLTPVPLPTTALLLVSGLIPLAWARRGRR